MGRPSSLDDRQWAEAGRMLASGESYSKVAKHFKIAKSTLVGRFSDRLETIKDVAIRLSAAEMDLAVLPVSDQVSVRSLTDQLKGLSEGLVRTAAINGKTAERLASLASRHVAGLEIPNDIHERGDKEKQDIKDRLSLTASLVETGNRATSLGVSLMNANRDANKDQGRPTLEDLITGGK